MKKMMSFCVCGHNKNDHIYQEGACRPGGNGCQQYCGTFKEFKPEVKEEGKKFDEGKPDMTMIPAIALNEMAHVLEFGKSKYGRENWKGGIHHRRLIASAMRHITAHNDGQTLDEESGLHHISHALVNLMMLTWMMANRPDLDDRDIIYEDKDSEGEDSVQTETYPKSSKSS